MEHRKANLEQPQTIDEARQRLVEVEAEITIMNDALTARFRYRDNDGMPMTPEEHLVWRKQATSARAWYLREQAVLVAWITEYEKDVRAEEEAERHRIEVEALAARRKAKHEAAREAAIAHAEYLRINAEREEATRLWKEEMIRLHGTDRPPPHIYQAQQIELERLRSDARQQVLDMREKSERLKRRRDTHKAWLKYLEIDDPAEGLEPENLLRLAYRFLLQLRQEGRVEYTYDEKQLLDAIAQRYLIQEAIEKSA